MFQLNVNWILVQCCHYYRISAVHSGQEGKLRSTAKNTEFDFCSWLTMEGSHPVSRFFLYGEKGEFIAINQLGCQLRWANKKAGQMNALP